VQLREDTVEPHTRGIKEYTRGIGGEKGLRNEERGGSSLGDTKLGGFDDWMKK